MKKMLQTIRKFNSAKLAVSAIALAFVAVMSVSSAAAAAPSYFDVDKGPKGPGDQDVCYTQTGIGWKAAGFQNLDHCLRYVATGDPGSQEACEDGWWYVYGFNTEAQCKEWVVLHGGGGYDGGL